MQDEKRLEVLCVVAEKERGKRQRRGGDGREGKGKVGYCLLLSDLRGRLMPLPTSVSGRDCPMHLAPSPLCPPASHGSCLPACQRPTLLPWVEELFRQTGGVIYSRNCLGWAGWLRREITLVVQGQSRDKYIIMARPRSHCPHPCLPSPSTCT